ncbi:hypothetical protein GCM10027436_27270 [Actinophytocola sediminis]
MRKPKYCSGFGMLGAADAAVGNTGATRAMTAVVTTAILRRGARMSAPSVSYPVVNRQHGRTGDRAQESADDGDVAP